MGNKNEEQQNEARSKPFPNTKQKNAATKKDGQQNLESWQTQAIHEGITEADQGLLFDHAEVIQKWEARAAAKVNQESP